MDIMEKDINSLRSELAREILKTDDLAVLAEIRKMLDGLCTMAAEGQETYGLAATEAEEQESYTEEGLRNRIRQAESEDPEGTDLEDFAEELRHDFSWLHG